MNEIINGRALIPLWVTTGRTVLCQKDPRNGNAVDNYRPISCLPIMWKQVTGIMAETLTRYLKKVIFYPWNGKGEEERVEEQKTN